TPEQEIVYRDLQRYSYGALGERAGRLAGGLTRLGIEPGDTVGVMDWDSHRYLECYFAVPLVGPRFHTITIRAAPEGVRYTINPPTSTRIRGPRHCTRPPRQDGSKASASAIGKWCCTR